MANSSVFSIVSSLAMVMWVLLIFLPKWKVTHWLAQFKLVPIILSLVYALYIGVSVYYGTSFDFGSLESVMNLFTKEDAVMAGWVHYLAFDLLIGMWMFNLNKKIGLSYFLMAPCLFFTFMLGPVGFLLFTLFSSLKKSN